MRNVYRIICHTIAACVVIQASAVAWATFTVINSVNEGSAISEDSGVTGFIVHSYVGQFAIPLLSLALLVIALIARVGIKWAAWLFLAVLVQVMLGYMSFEMPGLGILHGINAFVVLALAEMGARTVSSQKARTPAKATTSA